MNAEVIEIFERRRSWPTETKLRIVAEALEPATTIAATADLHGVPRGLVYSWMRAARQGRLRGLASASAKWADKPTTFMPVRIEGGLIETGRIEETAPAPAYLALPAAGRPVGAGPPSEPAGGHALDRRASPGSVPEPALPLPAAASWRRPGLVAITLANGRIVTVDDSIDVGHLARLVAALDAGAAPNRPGDRSGDGS